MASSTSKISDTSTTPPPRDTSWAAWRCLLGSFIIEAMIWGFVLTFGIFEAYYEEHPLFRGSKAIASIGLSSAAISHFATPLVTAIALWFPRYQRHFVCLGFCICVGSLVAASFATRTWHLVLTQGALLGAGWCLTVTPFLFILNEWFDKRRGLAYGILFASSGITSLIFPFLFEVLLEKTGFRTTLLIIAASILLFGGPGLFMIKPRHVPEPTSMVPKQLPPFLKSKVFYLFLLATFFQGLGFLLPRFFTPSFALALSMSHSQGAFLLAVFGFTQVIGQMSLGHLSDKVNIHLPVSLSCGVSAAAVLFIWGPAKTYFPLMVFSSLYASFGGAFSVFWVRIGMYITDDESGVMGIFSLFAASRGIAYLLAGPLSSLLVLEETDITVYGLLKYRPLILFVGISLTISALSGIGYIWREEVSRSRQAESSHRLVFTGKTDEEASYSAIDDTRSQELEPFIVAASEDGDTPRSSEEKFAVKPTND